MTSQTVIVPEAEDRPPQSTAITVTPMAMIERAIAGGANVEVLDKLMALQERWEASQGRKAFDRAIADAKAEIPPIIKNRTVDFTTAKGRTHYQHEDMAEIARTVDPILSKHGLSYRYRTSQDQRAVTVTCILSHRDGYSEETTLSSAADESGNKNHLQAIGSAATYLQRYTLKMALGLAASTDDDARKAETGKRISADQFFTLQGLIEETGADVPGLLKFIGAEDLEELTVSQFDKAVAGLRAKQKAAQK